MSRILIVGGSGLIGKAIFAEMAQDQEFDVYGTYFKGLKPSYQARYLKLSVAAPSNIGDILNNLQPEVIISCLRGDYKDQLTAHEIIAEYLAEIHGRLYFCSTANVFDNDLSTPHYEDDMPNPSTGYGNYKMECEKRIREILHDNACILRLPYIWGKDSPRMSGLLASLASHKCIEVYPKLFITTNTDVLLAKQLYYIIKQGLRGIFHLSSKDIINHKDFYERLIRGLGYRDVKMLDSFQEQGYFGLLSKRNNEFPAGLQFTNYSVVEYLTN